jgi:hypothetical protein
MLVGERLSLDAHSDAADVPPAEVGKTRLVKTGATKSGICRAGNHRSFAVEYREVRITEPVSANSIPCVNYFSGPVNLNDSAKFEVAGEKLLPRGKRQAEVEAAQGGHGTDLSFRGNGVDLSLFSTGPEVAVVVESETLWMIESFGKNFNRSRGI